MITQRTSKRKDVSELIQATLTIAHSLSPEDSLAIPKLRECTISNIALLTPAKNHLEKLVQKVDSLIGNMTENDVKGTVDDIKDLKKLVKEAELENLVFIANTVKLIIKNIPKQNNDTILSALRMVSRKMKGDIESCDDDIKENNDVLSQIGMQLRREIAN